MSGDGKITRAAWVSEVRWENALGALDARYAADEKRYGGLPPRVTVGEIVEATQRDGYWLTMTIEGVREQVTMRTTKAEAARVILAMQNGGKGPVRLRVTFEEEVAPVAAGGTPP